jgi:DNA-binding NarL/FixJ family response regulator
MPGDAGPRIRVLVADDHELVREGIRAVLKSHSQLHLLPAVRDGRALRDWVTRKGWDVLVVEPLISDADPLELLRELRDKASGRPILALSTLHEGTHGLRALKAGADGFLSKKCSSSLLAEAIERVVAGGKYVSPCLGEKLAWAMTKKEMNHPHEALSDREFQVLSRLVGGAPIKEIGRALSLSPKTVSTYRARILLKMGMASDAELIHYGVREKLVP